MKIVYLLSLMGLLPVFLNCVYDPPPKLRKVEVRNNSSDSLIVFYVKSIRLDIADTSLINNSINIPPNDNWKIATVEIIPPSFKGEISIGASKHWLDPIECKCVTFYFIKLSTYRKYSWANILSETSDNFQTVTWNINDVFNKDKYLVYGD